MSGRGIKNGIKIWKKHQGEILLKNSNLHKNFAKIFLSIFILNFSSHPHILFPDFPLQNEWLWRKNGYKNMEETSGRNLTQKLKFT